jgi:hypothetical protein
MAKKMFIFLALWLALFGATNQVLAQAGAKSNEDVLAQLQREGWKIVKDGVLQRELIPGEIESFVFGAAGFTWKIQDLQRQLRKLQAELQANPTPELGKAIASHRKAIANARKALMMAQSAEARGEEVDLSKESCVTNFSYDASAAQKSDVQGVRANASATFGTNCEGSTGQVYAYAFAKATTSGGETTETVTDGPRSGANVSASAYASRNGGSPCESYGFGEVVSSSLNPSSLSKAVSNFNCSQIPTTLTSSHPSTINLYGTDCVYVTWTTSFSGGTAPYSTVMYWNNSSLGSRTSYSSWFCNAQSDSSQTVTIRSDVTDSASKTGSESHTTTLQYHYYDPCDPYCP